MKRVISIMLTCLLTILIMTPLTSEGNVSALAKPSQVRGISISNVTASSCKISWKKAVGATGYQVYRKMESGVYKRVKTTSSRSFTNSGLEPNTTYTYKVRAYNKAGKGKYSSTRTVKTKAAVLTSVKHAAYARLLLEAELGTTNYSINSYCTATDIDWGEKAIVINYTINQKNWYAYVRLREGNASPSGDYFTIYQMEIDWLPNQHLNLGRFEKLSYLKDNAILGSTVNYNSVKSAYLVAKRAHDYQIIC